MLQRFSSIFLLAITLTLLSCSKSNKDSKDEVWIYTSVYKDAVSEIQNELNKDFPKLKINFYQAGSEEIATKFNAEVLSMGEPQADILMSSDRFWYEELAKNNKLVSFKSSMFNEIETEWKEKNGFYSAVSLPVMVLAYNNEVIGESDAPKSFSEINNEKWKDKFTSGSPLGSGTNFTTVAFLIKKYGWEYIQGLKKINTIAEGGNSSAMRRIQNKERPLGWVLLEDLLRIKNKDPRIKIVYPSDGAILHMNVLGITQKIKRSSDQLKQIQGIVDWFHSKKGQELMTKYYLYSPFKNIAPPVGAPPLSQIIENAPKWTDEFIKEIEESRNAIKEKYTQIYFM